MYTQTTISVITISTFSTLINYSSLIDQKKLDLSPDVKYMTDHSLLDYTQHSSRTLLLEAIQFRCESWMWPSEEWFTERTINQRHIKVIWKCIFINVLLVQCTCFKLIIAARELCVEIRILTNNWRLQYCTCI